MTTAFCLEMPQPGVATLTFDHPESRVNVLSRPNLAALDTLVRELATRRDIEVLVLRSAKRDNFCAGFEVHDIAMVDDADIAAEVSRRGQTIFAAWEALPFPTLAAVRGACMGGGTEWALASSHVVASDRADIRMGLPETRLGIIPGWGGCVRLPRKIGIEQALAIIVPGAAIATRKAAKIGLVDELIPDALFDHEVLRCALALRGSASRHAAGGSVRHMVLEGNPVGRHLLFEQARKQALDTTNGHYPAPLRAIEIVRVGIERGAAAGYEAEVRAIAELAVGDTCKNLVRVFLGMEAAKKAGRSTERRQVGSGHVREIAVLGAGVMGGGIAQLVADRLKIPVRLRDLAAGPLAAGMAHAAELFGKQVRRRRLTAPEMRRRMSLLRPTTTESGLAGCDIAIEAVVEKLEVKQQVFARLDALLAPSAILATNTSALSVDAIAAHCQHPERVVGLHFFNPVDKMPLVEVVAGRRTSPEVVQSTCRLALDLGKTPIVVADSPGFLVNRLLGFAMVEALWLLDEGVEIAHLDRVMVEWGQPLGPVALIDEVGIDVATKVAHTLAAAFGARLPLPSWLDALAQPDRLGAKTQRGFYRYQDGQRRDPDPTVLAERGPRPPANLDDSVITERILLRMVDEAARCLDEGVVASADELDLALILGTGFPPFRGGLCRWAQAQGLVSLVERAQELAHHVAPRFAPSEALRRRAANGGFFVASAPDRG